ncbi:MAG TPA: ATP-binding protein [Ktedonobacteraceae bacterium]|nr:ATP-binding protein [Ktedonobacteraceae bacterium]
MRGRNNRAGRWMLLLAAWGLCIFLLTCNALNSFPSGEALPSLFLAHFGFSSFTALIYLSVGSLVWLFARQRQVALWLFVFSLSLMVTFANETVSSSKRPFFTAITNVSVVLALASCAVLLLHFPYDYLAVLKECQQTHSKRSTHYTCWLIRGYIGTLLTFAGLVSAYILAKSMLRSTLPTWLDTVVGLYYIVAVVCILWTTIGAYCFSRDLRIRQQLLLLVIGILLACVPALFLTALPQTLHMPLYTIDGQVSTLPLLLLPLALGYSILRYQILVVDRYIRRTVAWVVGVISLALLCYLVVLASRIIFTGPELLLTQVICVTAIMAVSGPSIWWLARIATERLFFPEIRYYRRHMQRPESLERESFDLNKASELLILAAMQAFETREVCLYMLDERSGYYHLSPASDNYQGQGVMRGQLPEQLASFTQLFGKGDINRVEAHHPVLLRISSAPRPLFLREALEDRNDSLSGLARYLVTTPEEKIDPLLVPVRAQGKMIAILCLGERGDGRAYAGPDFEVIYLLLSHFSSMLETARLYVQASRHVAVLNTLYSASARLERAYLSIEEVAAAYATVVAEAMGGAAEIWLYVPERAILRRAVHAGTGPSLLQSAWIQQLQNQDWSAYFQEGSRRGTAPLKPPPACLTHLSGEPFVWLPLCKGQRRMGVLLLSFPGPRAFSVEEKRILGMFARQCAAAMENAQITIALRSAYERQKELDHLKDQFIMTASHELRTPLTAVQGYIELLREYNDELSAETRTEFIQKAHRGCDELALMVGNIMDASRLPTEAEQIRLAPVELISSVRHVVEIMDAIIKREQRQVKQIIAPGVFVQADDLRLRQILLNLMSNALKYSPAGTPISVLAMQGQGLIKISVRDAGLGVPLKEQEKLFERFIRLERDMNSPVRGAGLGLYITKRLVEAMGGRLWVESSGVPGEGSTFSFTLQRAVLPQQMLNSTVPLLAQRGN